MIAKAKSIKHGFNAINYALKKNAHELLKLNKLDVGVVPNFGTPDASLIWDLFKLSYVGIDQNKPGRKMENNLIRIEISPSDEEAAQLKTKEDWEKLLEDFITEMEKDFDPRTPEEKKRGVKKPDSHLNIRGSKYVAVIHHDSKHPHIHLLVNRVDEDGITNFARQIGRRAVEAADRVSRSRGWKNPRTHGQKTPKADVEAAMTDALRDMPRFNWRLFSAELAKRGYKMVNVKTTDKRLPNGKIQKVVASYGIQGDGKYWKASSIGSRQFTASRCYETWWSLHPELHQVKGNRLPSVMSNEAEKIVESWYNNVSNGGDGVTHSTLQDWFEHIRNSMPTDDVKEVQVKHGNTFVSLPVDRKAYDNMMQGARESPGADDMSNKEISESVMPLAATLFSIGTAPAELCTLMVELMEEQAPEVGQGGGGVHGELSRWGSDDEENARRAGLFAASVKGRSGRSRSSGRGR